MSLELTRRLRFVWTGSALCIAQTCNYGGNDVGHTGLVSDDEASQACQGGGGVDRDSKSQNYDGYDVGHTGLVIEDRSTQEPKLRVRDYIMNDLNRYIKKFWPKSELTLFGSSSNGFARFEGESSGADADEDMNQCYGGSGYGW